MKRSLDGVRADRVAMNPDVVGHHTGLVARGASTPRVVAAKSIETNWRIFICNSLLARDFQIAIEDGGSEMPERNQDP
jgi:hypothetical protein